MTRFDPATRAWVIDCETTGLSGEDRMITFGAVEMLGDRPTGRTMHLVFNPERESHWAARRVHGWSSKILCHQPSFRLYGAEIRAALSGCDLIVGHNIAFDMGFVTRELAHAGLPGLRTPHYCTRIGWSRVRPGERATLDHCAAALGLDSRGGTHNAIEDATLTAGLYAHLAFGSRVRLPAPVTTVPTNYVAAA